MSLDPALDKMTLFLRHAQDRDLSESELYGLKADAFEEIARQSEERDPRLAADARDAASRAREVAAQKGPQT